MFQHGSDPGDAGRKSAGAGFSANFLDLYLPIFIPHVPHTQLSAGAATALTVVGGGGGGHINKFSPFILGI